MHTTRSVSRRNWFLIHVPVDGFHDSLCPDVRRWFTVRATSWNAGILPATYLGTSGTSFPVSWAIRWPLNQDNPIWRGKVIPSLWHSIYWKEQGEGGDVCRSLGYSVWATKYSKKPLFLWILTFRMRNWLDWNSQHEYCLPIWKEIKNFKSIRICKQSIHGRGVNFEYLPYWDSKSMEDMLSALIESLNAYHAVCQRDYGNSLNKRSGTLRKHKPQS